MADDEWIGPADGTSRRVLCFRPAEPTATPALRGLAANPAAPTEVLMRLLRTRADAVRGALGRRAALPAPVLEAMLRHSDARVRGALAGNRHVDPQVRSRLADDPDGGVVARLRADRTLPLPDHVFRPELDRLDGHAARGLLTPPELKGEVEHAIAGDRRVLAAAVRHPEPRIRLAAIPEAPSRLHSDAVVRLLLALTHDESPEVRVAAAASLASRDRDMEPVDLTRDGHEVRWILRYRRLSRALVDRVVATGYDYDLACLAANPSAPSDVVATLFDHPEPDVRRALTEREDLTPAQLARLAADPDGSVRASVSVHPALSEEQRATIALDGAIALGAGFGYTGNPWDPTRPVPPVEQSEAWARSVNPLLRRRAARDERLPAGLVPVLAGDPDPAVRGLAALDPAAPADLIDRLTRDRTKPCGGRWPGALAFPSTGSSRCSTTSNWPNRRPRTPPCPWRAWKTC